jgi:hypothetical protein
MARTYARGTTNPRAAIAFNPGFTLAADGALTLPTF